MEAWEGYREDDFPKLGQASKSGGAASSSNLMTPACTLEDLVAKCTLDISKLQEDIKVSKDEMKVMKEREKKHEEFLRFWSGRDVQVVAGEILTWSCGKRSVKDGDGRHLFAPEAALSVTCGAAVFKLPANEYKELSRRVINARNECTHFDTLESLETAQKTCKKMINFFPQLKETFPEQVACIENYNKLKCALPEFFK